MKTNAFYGILILFLGLAGAASASDCEETNKRLEAIYEKAQDNPFFIDNDFGPATYKLVNYANSSSSYRPLLTCQALRDASDDDRSIIVSHSRLSDGSSVKVIDGFEQKWLFSEGGLVPSLNYVSSSHYFRISCRKVSNYKEKSFAIICEKSNYKGGHAYYCFSSSAENNQRCL